MWQAAAGAQACACSSAAPPADAASPLPAPGLPFQLPQVWDVRQARASLSLAAHQFEVLAADWCKYNDCVIATGSVDKSVKVG